MNVARSYTLELLDEPSEIELRIDEINRFRRYIFNNAYGDFLVFPSTGDRISHHETFSNEKDEYVPIEMMDDYNPEQAPYSIENREQAIIYRDKKRMKDLLYEQLIERDGQVALLMNESIIKGMTYGYRAKLKDIFNLEWANKYIYSQNRSPLFERGWNDFLVGLNNASLVQFDENTEMYCWNCAATDIDVRGLGLFPKMTKLFFNNIAKQKFDPNLPLIADVMRGTSSHRLLSSCDGFEVSTMSQKGKCHEILMVANLAQVTKSQLK